jgi:hypothetical protein
VLPISCDVKGIHITQQMEMMMTALATETQPQMTTRPGWFARAEMWLDARGKGAWIAAMVLGFVFFWPVGLALLFYMIWSKKMFSNGCGARRMKHHNAAWGAMKPSGNTAFDAYKEETLRRLQDEQESFEAFMERLRAAKDKAEFDEFMDERAKDAKARREETSQDA